MKTELGDIVHYVSYGTPGGEYPSVCRAAIVTGVVNEDEVHMTVFNPEGFFLNKNVRYQDPTDPEGGTWHFCDEEH